MSARSVPLERAFAWLFVPIAAASWGAMLLAELGAFTLGRVLGIALAGGCAAWAVDARDRDRPIPRNLHVGDPPPVGRLEIVGLTVTLAVAATLFAWPGQYSIEGADASVYLATGRTLLASGGLRPPDSLAAICPPEARDGLLSHAEYWPFPLVRFSGGFYVGRDRTTLVPEFFHLAPAWIATFSALFGARGGYWVNVAFGLLAVLTTWLIGRRSWSPSAGIIAALLLATSFAQVWYARMASSEMLAQWLLLAAIGFTLAAFDRPSRLYGACAGVAAGLACFARLDALVVLIPLASAWLVVARRRRVLGAAWAWNAASFAAVGGHAVVHAATVASGYTARIAHDAWSVAGVRLNHHPVLAVAAVAALAAVALSFRRLTARTWLPLVATLVVIAAPVASPAVTATALTLLTPPGVAALVAGFGLAAWRERTGRLLFLVVPFACEAALWLAWGEKTSWPEDFRRLVPGVLPLGALFVAGLSGWMTSRSGWSRRLAWLLPAALAASSLAQLRPVLVSPPMQGVHDQLEALAARVPVDSVVLTDRSVPGHVALALQTAFGKPSLRIEDRVEPRVLRRFVTNVCARGGRVFVVLGNDEVEAPRRLWAADFQDLHVTLAGSVSLKLQTLASSAVAFPREIRSSAADVRLYEARAMSPGTETELPVTIDIGEADMPYAAHGFHASEQLAGRRVRWTGPDARVLLPAVKWPAGRVAAIVLTVASARPSGVALPRLEVSLDGVPIGVIEAASRTFSDYRFTVGHAAAERLTAGGAVLTLRSATFVPKSLGTGDDGRVLGIMLDRVRIDAADGDRAREEPHTHRPAFVGKRDTAPPDMPTVAASSKQASTMPSAFKY